MLRVLRVLRVLGVQALCRVDGWMNSTSPASAMEAKEASQNQNWLVFRIQMQLVLGLELEPGLHLFQPAWLIRHIDRRYIPAAMDAKEASQN